MTRRVAMGRNRTALQAVLSGLAGGFQGLAQRQARDEETRRYEDQRLREGKRDAAAAERQTVMDALALAEQGYIEQGERARTVDASRPAVGRVLGSVASTMAGAPTGFDPADTETVAAAAPAFGTPVSAVSLGGRTYERTETPAQAALRKANVEAARARTTRQETLAERSAQANVDAFNAAERTRAETERVVAERRATLRAAYPTLTDGQIDALAQGLAKSSEFVPEQMTPHQKASLALDQRRIALDEQKARAAGGTATAGQPVRLPVSAQNKLAGYDAGLEMVGSLREEMAANPNATGLKGLLFTAALDRLDPEGVGVRAALEALSGEIRNQRFGGALTASEAKFAERFLPGATDRYDAAVKKLDQLEKYLNQKRTGLFTAAQAGGGAAAARAPARLPGETVDQYLARTGGRP